MSDFMRRRHYEVKEIKIYLTFLSLKDIYFIIEMDKIDQLEYL